MSDSDLSDRIDRIQQNIRSSLSIEAPGAGLSEAQAETAGRLVNVLPYLQRLKNARVNVGQAEIAAAALRGSEDELALANAIVLELENRVRIYTSVVRSVLAGRSVVAQVLLGVAAYLGLLAVILMVLWWSGVPLVGGAPSGERPEVVWLWIILGGSVGGITSLVIRLDNFAAFDRWGVQADPKLLFFTGMLKPAVGVIFALFLWAGVHTGVISFDISAARSHPGMFAFALSFVAGFTERLAADVANRVPIPTPTDRASTDS